MSFLEPWFLLGTLVALVPLILHLMHRQRAPRLPFSTLRFVRASVQRTRRRKIVQDALLLAARMAILFFLAAGLARPAVRALHGLLPGRGALAVAIVLDNSGSMAAQDATETRFERAQIAARQILASLSPGDQVALLTTAPVRLPALNQLLTNHELIYQAVQQCPVVPGTGDLAQAIARASRLLATSKNPVRELYVITDCQLQDWQDVAERLGYALTAPLVVVDVYRSVPPNVTLADVQFLSPGPLVGLPVMATVELRNGGATEETRRVEVLVAGRRVASSDPVTVAAGGRRTTHVRFRLDRAGHRPVQVRLTGDDALLLDDARYAAQPVHEQLRVALVTAPGEDLSDPSSDAYYVAQVLQLDEPGRWPIRLSRFTWRELAAEPLQEYAAVFLCGLPSEDEQTVKRTLMRYVGQGGRMIWLPTNTEGPGQWQQWCAAAEQLVPGTVAAMMAAVDEGVGAGWRIGWLDLERPLLRPIRIEPAAYTEIRVFRYLKWRPAEDAIVVGRLETGDPLLLTRAVDRGTTWALATVPHVDWTTLPVDPLFVPLMTRLVLAAAEQEGGDSLSVLCGQAFRYPVDELGGTVKGLVVVRPDGELVRPAMVNDEGGQFVEVVADRPGIYTIRRLDTREAVVRFAANAAADEFDLRHAPVRRLREQLDRLGGRYVASGSDLGEQIARLRRGTELMEPLLWSVLVLLALEALVANRVPGGLPLPEPQQSRGRSRIPRELLAEMDRMLAGHRH